MPNSPASLGSRRPVAVDYHDVLRVLAGSHTPFPRRARLAFDHLMPIGVDPAGDLRSWTLLSASPAQPDGLPLLLVNQHRFRPPAMLARSPRPSDSLRRTARLGIGAGSRPSHPWPARYEHKGLPFPRLRPFGGKPRRSVHRHPGGCGRETEPFDFERT